MGKNDDSVKAGKRALITVIIDAVILFLCSFAALLTKYAPQIEREVALDVLLWTPPLAGIYILVFAVFGMYRVLWKYADSYQLLKQGMAAIVAFGVTFILNLALTLIRGYRPLSNNYLITFCMFAIAGILAQRLVSQNFRRSRLRSDGLKDVSGRRILVVGAGDAGAHIVEMFNKSRSEMGSVEVIVDDDESKRGYRIDDVPVAGSIQDIPYLVDSEDITDIIIALPTATHIRLNEISRICLDTGCFVRVMDKLKHVEDEAY